MNDVDNTNTIFFLCSKNQEDEPSFEQCIQYKIVGFGMAESFQPHHTLDNLGQEILLKLGRPISERHNFVPFD